MVRFKHRYILAELLLSVTEHKTIKANSSSVYHLVVNAVKNAYGDFGIAILQSSLNVKYVNPHTRTVIIRAKRGCHQMVIAALALVKNFKYQTVMFNTLHVSGTIKSCQKFLVKHHKKQLNFLLKECMVEGEKEALRQSLSESALFADDVKAEETTLESDESM